MCVCVFCTLCAQACAIIYMSADFNFPDNNPFYVRICFVRMQTCECGSAAAATAAAAAGATKHD